MSLGFFFDAREGNTPLHSPAISLRLVEPEFLAARPPAHTLRNVMSTSCASLTERIVKRRAGAPQSTELYSIIERIFVHSLRRRSSLVECALDSEPICWCCCCEMA